MIRHLTSYFFPERTHLNDMFDRDGKLVREMARGDGRRAPAFAGKRRDNTQLDWRVAARAQGHSRPNSLLRGSNPATLSVRSNELAQRSLTLPPREALLMVTLLNHPWLLEARCEQIAELPLTSRPLAGLRDAMLELLARNIALDRAQMRTQLSLLGLEKVVAPAERAIVEDLTFRRSSQATLPTGYRTVAALYTSEEGGRIDVYDDAFVPTTQFVGAVTDPKPFQLLVVVHELGHALHDAPARFAPCQSRERRKHRAHVILLHHWVAVGGFHTPEREQNVAVDAMFALDARQLVFGSFRHGRKLDHC